jgi:hypothetical protein
MSKLSPPGGQSIAAGQYEHFAFTIGSIDRIQGSPHGLGFVKSSETWKMIRKV